MRRSGSEQRSERPELLAAHAPIARPLVRQFEVDGNASLNFYRFAIQQIWLVLPLLDGIAGRPGELRVSVHHFDVRNISFLRDSGQQLHRPFNMHAKGIRRIRRSNLLVEQTLRNTLGNAEGLEHWLEPGFGRAQVGKRPGSGRAHSNHAWGRSIGPGGRLRRNGWNLSAFNDQSGSVRLFFDLGFDRRSRGVNGFARSSRAAVSGTALAPVSRGTRRRPESDVGL